MTCWGLRVKRGICILTQVCKGFQDLMAILFPPTLQTCKEHSYKPAKHFYLKLWQQKPPTHTKLQLLITALALEIHLNSLHTPYIEKKKNTLSAVATQECFHLLGGRKVLQAFHQGFRYLSCDLLTHNACPWKPVLEKHQQLELRVNQNLFLHTVRNECTRPICAFGTSVLHLPVSSQLNCFDFCRKFYLNDSLLLQIIPDHYWNSAQTALVHQGISEDPMSALQQLLVSEKTRRCIQ